MGPNADSQPLAEIRDIFLVWRTSLQAFLLILLKSLRCRQPRRPIVSYFHYQKFICISQLCDTADVHTHRYGLSASYGSGLTHVQLYSCSLPCQLKSNVSSQTPFAAESPPSRRPFCCVSVPAWHQSHSDSINQQHTRPAHALRLECHP